MGHSMIDEYCTKSIVPGGSMEMSAPIALAREVELFSVVRAKLDGMELILWRGDDERVRVWEDRCPHRSVKLHAGRNLGDCIQEVYHGWKFGKDGSVIEIPSENHMARKDIRVRIVESIVVNGFVWASLGRTVEVDKLFKPDRSDVLLKPIFINAPAATVERVLQSETQMRLIASPADEQSCVVFGYTSLRRSKTEVETARSCSFRLNSLRRRLEVEGE